MKEYIKKTKHHYLLVYPQELNLNTMLQKKKRRIKTIESKIEKLKTDFPLVDFKNMEIKRAYEKYYELSKELIYLTVDVKFCQTENRNEMCSDCNCWKAVANRCSQPCT